MQRGIVWLDREEGQRSVALKFPHAAPAGERGGFRLGVIVGREVDEAAVAEKTWVCHSLARNTLAGFAARGRSAKRRPAVSVANIPPKMIALAEDQIGVKSVSMM